MPAGRSTMHLPLVLLVVVAAAAGAAPAVQAWTDCSSGPTVFTVADVTLTPEAISPGDLAKFSIQAESSKEVQGGMVQMIVHYAGMPIWTQLDNLCDKASCPIKPGPTEVNYSQLFPSITPFGSYSVTLNGHSGTDSLFCVTVDFQVVPPQSDEATSGGTVAAFKGAMQQALRAHRKTLS